MEIVEGIHRIDEASNNMAHSNVYLLSSDSNLIVIDTGIPGNAKKIVDYILKIGRQPKELSTIILTHYHVDHTGSAKDLQELTEAKVAASPQDAEFIDGTKPYPKPKNLLLRAASAFIKPAPVNVGIKLKDSEVIGELSVISAPGHTPGSIFLYDSSKKVLFCGDTLRLEDGKVTRGPKHFVWDEEKEKQSIGRLEAIEFDVLLPGHAEYLKGSASVAVRELIAKWR